MPSLHHRLGGFPVTGFLSKAVEGQEYLADHSLVKLACAGSRRRVTQASAVLGLPEGVLQIR